MRQKFFLVVISLFISVAVASAQTENSSLQQRVENDLKTVVRYYQGGMYKEAFEKLRTIDQNISNDRQSDASVKSAARYLTSKERFNIYMKIRKTQSVKEQLDNMENHANNANSEELKNDLLYTKAIYYYSYGQIENGNAAFQQLSDKMTSSQDYDKLDEVFQTLIATGRKSNNAYMVSQSYNNYIAWKDSVSAIKHAAQIDSLKQQITTHEATIAEKDSSLSSRMTVIIGLGILAAALAAALVLGALVLMRYIMLTRKQKKTIDTANENNALKAKFIKNISAQLNPTLQKLDSRQPEVKALQDFSTHIQTLSDLESTNDAVEREDVQVAPFAESLMESVRNKVKGDVTLTVNAPKMNANINKEYVTHILSFLLNQAAANTPDGGHITLDFKKRGPHKIQFLVSDTGTIIPEEKREDVFKPFLEIKDLTKGDGLELPICRQMALKMDGDLTIDPAFTKGTRFVLDLMV